MTMFFRLLSDLDLDDPRRTRRPSDTKIRIDWERGLVPVTSVEFVAALEKKEKMLREVTSEVEPKQSSWYRPVLPFKGKANPSRTMGVDTSYSQAQPSSHYAVRSCSTCGITHWRRHCPLECDPGAPETAPK
ncbi:PREDICTED: uncharacterized protein LOC101298247 [Fragaria vesca subsp. vesca]|uniref:uncharacterized protein LOC101298247 n=1 Tax=Fragaria vesca subsp. vesca TaxID=101020 RepID=UPI0002C2EE1A|nr:PREDICTED: uncharacterized protein LOC101298247 [Fragaria vesca subsp. vesca]